MVIDDRPREAERRLTDHERPPQERLDDRPLERMDDRSRDPMDEYRSRDPMDSYRSRERPDDDRSRERPDDDRVRERPVEQGEDLSGPHERVDEDQPARHRSRIAELRREIQEVYVRGDQ